MTVKSKILSGIGACLLIGLVVASRFGNIEENYSRRAGENAHQSNAVAHQQVDSQSRPTPPKSDDHGHPPHVAASNQAGNAFNEMTISDILLIYQSEFRRDPASFLALLKTRVKDAAKHRNLEVLLFADWAQSDPMAAVSAAKSCRFENASNTSIAPARIVLNQWAQEAPADVANWLSQNPWYRAMPDDHEISVGAVFIAWAKKSPDEALLWMMNNQADLGPSLGAAIESFVFSLAVNSRDFPSSLDVAKLHPEPKKRANLIREITQMQQRAQGGKR